MAAETAARAQWLEGGLQVPCPSGSLCYLTTEIGMLQAGVSHYTS